MLTAPRLQMTPVQLFVVRAVLKTSDSAAIGVGHIEIRRDGGMSCSLLRPRSNLTTGQSGGLPSASRASAPSNTFKGGFRHPNQRYPGARISPETGTLRSDYRDSASPTREDEKAPDRTPYLLTMRRSVRLDPRR